MKAFIFMFFVFNSGILLADEQRLTYPAPVCNKGTVCVRSFSECKESGEDANHPTAEASVGITTEMVCVTYDGKVVKFDQYSALKFTGLTAEYGKLSAAITQCQRQVDEEVQSFGRCTSPKVKITVND